MHLKQFIPFVVLLAGTHCFAQDKSLTDITDITKVTFLDPGIGYEKRIGKYQSLYVQGFMSISGALGYSSAVGFISEFHLDPAASIEYRYYYNFLGRQERGKRVAMNSLNYLSPFFRTIFPKRDVYTTDGSFEHKRRAVYSMGFTWGLQRNYNSRLSLDFNVGLGYIFKEAPIRDASGQAIGGNSGQLSIPGRFSLGFWLNKRK